MWELARTHAEGHHGEDQTRDRQVGKRVSTESDYGLVINYGEGGGLQNGKIAGL